MKGFYRNEGGTWEYAKTKVVAPNYTLEVSKKNTYQYPVDGWLYFQKAPAAYTDWFNEQIEYKLK